MAVTRRDVLRGLGYASVTAGLGAVPTAFGPGSAARADPDDDGGDNDGGGDARPKLVPIDWGLGTMLDFSAGFPSPAAIKAAGHRGSMAYVCDQAGGEEWMKAKPLTRAAASNMLAGGLLVASVWQWGGEKTADWRRGYDGGVKGARRAVELHQAAGGPPHAAIYACVDDNPPEDVWDDCIADYLRGFEDVIGHERLGVFCSPPVIDWCLDAGLGSYFWQHDWGNPTMEVHRAAHLHQLPGAKKYVQHIDGVECDVSIIFNMDFGQW